MTDYKLWRDMTDAEKAEILLFQDEHGLDAVEQYVVWDEWDSDNPIWDWDECDRWEKDPNMAYRIPPQCQKVEFESHGFKVECTMRDGKLITSIVTLIGEEK